MLVRIVRRQVLLRRESKRLESKQLESKQLESKRREPQEQLLELSMVPEKQEPVQELERAAPAAMPARY